MTTVSLCGTAFILPRVFDNGLHLALLIGSSTAAEKWLGAIRTAIALRLRLDCFHRQKANLLSTL